MKINLDLFTFASEYDRAFEQYRYYYEVYTRDYSNEHYEQFKGYENALLTINAAMGFDGNMISGIMSFLKSVRRFNERRNNWNMRSDYALAEYLRKVFTENQE